MVVAFRGDGQEVKEVLCQVNSDGDMDMDMVVPE